MCASCGGRISITAGTIFDRTRTPLTVWFTACWLFTTGKDGISALSLKRTLEIGSYQTAWAVLHRLRSVLVRPGRDRLAGTVEVDETYIGGEETGLRGGRARGKKVLTGMAVEVQETKRLGRCRLQPIADASAASLHAFVPITSSPAPGSLPTAGRATTDSRSWVTSTTGAAYEPPGSGSEVKIPTNCSLLSTGSPLWSSAGCLAHTRAPWATRTCPVT